MTAPKLYVLPARWAVPEHDEGVGRLVRRTHIYDANGVEFRNLSEVSVRPHPKLPATSEVLLHLWVKHEDVSIVESPPQNRLRELVDTWRKYGPTKEAERLDCADELEALLDGLNSADV